MPHYPLGWLVWSLGTHQNCTKGEWNVNGLKEARRLEALLWINLVLRTQVIFMLTTPIEFLAFDSNTWNHLTVCKKRNAVWLVLKCNLLTIQWQITHTHAHTHTLYIYIYIYRERERETDRQTDRHDLALNNIHKTQPTNQLYSLLHSPRHL